MTIYICIMFLTAGKKKQRQTLQHSIEQNFTFLFIFLIPGETNEPTDVDNF